VAVPSPQKSKKATPMIDREAYVTEKTKGVSQKKSLEEQSSALLKGRADWLEPFQNWILTARNVGEIAIEGSPQEKKFLRKSVWLEPCPRLQKSPWFLRKTVVTTRRKLVE
jgi:hypothetical protein